MKPVIPEGKILVQFDGVCMLCSRTVNFILKADRKQKFVFSALPNSGSENPGESVLVTDGQTVFTHFDAVLKIAKELGGIYRLAAVFRILPARWRLAIYQFIARNRYRWFGVMKTCYLPSEEVRERFIQNSNSSFSN